MTVKVFAQQFSWRFEYPDSKGVKSYELVMPVNRNITFELQSADVIHSFWIPAMGQKQDVVPGIDTSIVITPTRTGHFPLVCAELCGLGHATMRSPVTVVSQADFDKWVAEQQGERQQGRRRRRRVLVGRLWRLSCVQAREHERRDRPRPRQPRGRREEGGRGSGGVRQGVDRRSE